MILILDIDSTLANNDHRALLLKKSCIACGTQVDSGHRAVCSNCGSTDTKIAQRSWDKFLDPILILEDTPYPKAQEGVFKLRELGATIHYITGRNESLREVTERWLQAHFAWDESKERLIMRPVPDDSVPASEYKERAFLDLRNSEGWDPSEVVMFMEDDPFVFRAYSKYGMVIKCPEGWDSFCPTPKTGFESGWRR